MTAGGGGVSSATGLDEAAACFNGATFCGLAAAFARRAGARLTRFVDGRRAFPRFGSDFRAGRLPAFFAGDFFDFFAITPPDRPKSLRSSRRLYNSRPLDYT